MSNTLLWMLWRLWGLSKLDIDVHSRPKAC